MYMYVPVMIYNHTYLVLEVPLLCIFISSPQLAHQPLLLSYQSTLLRQPTMYKTEIKVLYTNRAFRNSTPGLKSQKKLSREARFDDFFFTNVALWYHSSTISVDLLVLHCDEGVVWCVDGILEYLSLSVQLEGHLVVGRQLLPCLCDLVKMELQSQQHRTQALSGNYIIRKQVTAQSNTLMQCTCTWTSTEQTCIVKYSAILTAVDIKFLTDLYTHTL